MHANGPDRVPLRILFDTTYDTKSADSTLSPACLATTYSVVLAFITNRIWMLQMQRLNEPPFIGVFLKSRLLVAINVG